MSTELILMRVDPGNKGIGIINLFELVGQRLRDLGQPSKLAVISSKGDSFQIELPGGTAAVHFDHAVFPIIELDALTINVVFSILRAGRMVALTEGGKRAVILAESSQRASLPEEEWQNPEQSPVCRTANQFRRQLQEWYEIHNAHAARAFPTHEQTSPNANETNNFGGENLVGQRSESPGVFIGSEWRCDVFLHHFNRSGYNVSKDVNILPQLAQAAALVLGKEGTVMAKGQDLLKIELPTGSGLLRVHGALFDLSDVDVLTGATLLQIAQAGDMAVITRKPKGVQTILTDRKQLSLMPRNWRSTAEFCSVCDAPQELMERLRCHLELDLPINQRATFGAHTPDPLPGTVPIVPETVYVEAKPTNIPASKHLDSLFNFVGRECRAKNASDELAGLLGTHNRKLITPGKRSFYAYSYTAGCKGWLEIVRRFASSSGLATAQIVNFDTFMQDDGISFPASECSEPEKSQQR